MCGQRARALRRRFRARGTLRNACSRAFRSVPRTLGGGERRSVTDCLYARKCAPERIPELNSHSVENAGSDHANHGHDGPDAKDTAALPRSFFVRFQRLQWRQRDKCGKCVGTARRFLNRSGSRMKHIGKANFMRAPRPLVQLHVHSVVVVVPSDFPTAANFNL